MRKITLTIILLLLLTNSVFGQGFYEEYEEEQPVDPASPEFWQDQSRASSAPAQEVAQALEQNIIPQESLKFLTPEQLAYNDNIFKISDWSALNQETAGEAVKKYSE